MYDALSGYWDFYQDSDGYWRWCFACAALQRVIGSETRYASSDDCIRDAMRYGYSGHREDK